MGGRPGLWPTVTCESLSAQSHTCVSSAHIQNEKKNYRTGHSSHPERHTPPAPHADTPSVTHGERALSAPREAPAIADPHCNLHRMADASRGNRRSGWRQNKKSTVSRTHAKKSSLYSRPMCMCVSLSLCICPPPQCGVCAQSGPARPRLRFAPGGGGAGSPAQACPGCAGVRTPEVWRVLESGPTC